MTLAITLDARDCPLSAGEDRQIRRRLEELGNQLSHDLEPNATLVLSRHISQRQVEAALRIALDPPGPQLVSRRAAESATHAVRLASEDIERQLERRMSQVRGEPTFGVPSRRLPRAERRGTRRR